jgi:hypothetical protein
MRAAGGPRSAPSRPAAMAREHSGRSGPCPARDGRVPHVPHRLSRTRQTAMARAQPIAGTRAVRRAAQALNRDCHQPPDAEAGPVAQGPGLASLCQHATEVPLCSSGIVRAWRGAAVGHQTRPKSRYDPRDFEMARVQDLSIANLTLLRDGDNESCTTRGDTQSPSANPVGTNIPRFSRRRVAA